MVYVGFSTTDSIVSKIIRWFTKSEVSHAFFVIDLLGRAWVLESGFHGVTLSPAEKFTAKNTIKYLAQVHELDEPDVATVMNDLGENYDFGGLFGSAFVVIGRWFKQKWRNPWADPKAMFCSEFVVKSLQECGFPGADQLVPQDTTPQDLKDFLMAHYMNQEP